MKKVFISILMAAFTFSAYAAETARVTIRLTSTNATYGNDELELKENSDRNASYESGYDAEKMMSQANKHSVLLYAFVESNPCSTVATDNLDGTVIGFTTNKYDTDYKLVFSNVSGRELKLYDRILNTETVITNSLEYSFSATAGRVAVSDRFYINLTAADIHTITTNAYGFCSFASAETVTLPSGLVAYKGAYEASDNSLTLTSIGQVVPANTGVILWTAEEISKEFAYTIGGSAPAVSGNDFVGVTAAADPAGISADIYCLSGNALLKYVGSDAIPAGKAYLPIASGSAAPRRISMRFNQPTAIDNVEVEGVKAEKFVENGQIFIRRGNEVFNLQGQLVK